MSVVASTPSPIRHVSDTARWVAMYRAFESERPDALFHDPYARRLAGERGDAIVNTLPYGDSMAWSMVVRTVVMDELILRCVAQGARTVLNLGAGLDTRAFRLGLPAALRWIDVDLPELIAYRRDCLAGAAPACEHHHLAADLADAEARARVLALAGAAGGPYLVVTEGLLVYLAPDDVTRLAKELHLDHAARWWLTDLIAPLLQRAFGALWKSHLHQANAPFRFAPADSRAFFEPLGWHQAEFRSSWDESIRLHRPVPLAWWWSAFGRLAMPSAYERLRRMSSIVLLERG